MPEPAPFPPLAVVGSAIAVIVLLATASFLGAVGFADGGGLPPLLVGLFDRDLPAWSASRC